MLDLIGKTEDRFSCDAVQLELSYVVVWGNKRDRHTPVSSAEQVNQSLEFPIRKNKIFYYQDKGNYYTRMGRLMFAFYSHVNKSGFLMTRLTY